MQGEDEWSQWSEEAKSELQAITVDVQAHRVDNLLMEMESLNRPAKVMCFISP